MDSFRSGTKNSRMVEAQYRICIFCFLSTPNFAKTKRGANGKFLPKSRIFSCWKIPLPRLIRLRSLRPCEATLLTLLFYLRLPNSKTNEPKFCKILFLQKLYTFWTEYRLKRSCESVPHFLTPKNSFCKTSSALFRHLPETLRVRKRMPGASARLIEGFCNQKTQ